MTYRPRRPTRRQVAQALQLIPPKEKQMQPDDFSALTTNQRRALALAMRVRGAMENFHARHLSDAQMAELNPLIRRALLEGLLLLDWADFPERMAPDNLPLHLWADHLLHGAVAAIPDYWEVPSEDEVLAAWRANVERVSGEPQPPAGERGE